MLVHSKRRAVVAFLKRHPALWTTATVERLYEQVVRGARADLRQAARLADAAHWLSQELNDDSSRAQALRALGHVALMRGRYTDALERYESALVLFRRLGRDV